MTDRAAIYIIWSYIIPSRIMTQVGIMTVARDLHMQYPCQSVL